jgi:hypothetical protein
VGYNCFKDIYGEDVEAVREGGWVQFGGGIWDQLRGVRVLNRNWYSDSITKVIRSRRARFQENHGLRGKLLFSASMDKEAKISELRRWVDAKRLWVLRWRREMFQWEK